MDSLDQAMAETRALLERVAAYFKLPLDLKKAQKSTTWDAYAYGNTIFKALGYLNTHEPYKAAMVLEDLAGYFLERIGRVEPKDLLKDSTADRVLDATALAVDVTRNAQKWRKLIHGEAIEELKDCGLFTEEELKNKIEMFTGVQVDDIFDKDYVRVYTLKIGSAPLPSDMRFKVMKEVQVSRDLDGYIRAAHYLSAKTPNTIVFVPFFKVEERLDLSFWSFFIVYEDHVWVATDQKEFHNPENKDSTRRTERVRDKKLENMWLPDVFTMLEKKRSKSRDIEVPFGGVKRLLTIKLKDFHPAERFFLLRLAEKIIRKCLREDLIQATTMGLHTERLLLEHKGSVPDKSETLEFWTKDAQAHHADLMATVPTETTRALVPMDYSIVVRSKTYDRNWLGPVDQLEALAHWTVVDERRAELQKHFSSLAKREDKDRADLQKVFDSRENEILDFVFSAQVIGWIGTAVDDFGSNSIKSGERFVVDFISPYEKGDHWGNRFTIGLSGGRVKDLYSRDKRYRAKCLTCDFMVKKPIKTIHIRHWAQLQKLVGGDRNAIPPFYRCYKAHNFVPYVGNSILDNVNPLTRIEDPCTEKEPNGINIQVFLCGVCANKRLKGRPDNLVWDGSKLILPAELPKGIKRGKYHGWVMFKHGGLHG